MKSNIIGNCKFCGKSIYEGQGHYLFLEDIFCNRECLYAKIDKQASFLDEETLKLIHDFIKLEANEVMTATLLLNDLTDFRQIDENKRDFIIGALTKIKNDSEGHIKALTNIAEEFEKTLTNDSG